MANKPISSVDTPDPWVIAANNKYYLTFTSGGDHVEIWSSKDVNNFHDCEKTIVWQPDPSQSGIALVTEIWAPELHRIHDKWYIYASAGTGKHHRTILLSSDDNDPMVTEHWHYLGALPNMPDQWAIDATVFHTKPLRMHHDEPALGSNVTAAMGPGNLYVCWSGWPEDAEPDTEQNLYIKEMETPEKAKAGPAVCISRPTLPWERLEDGKRGINEGPTFVNTPGFRGIVFSANGSWTNNYALGLLRLTDNGDPLRAESWEKRPEPLLCSDPDKGGPFGPGHASFLTPSERGNEQSVRCMYHATGKADDGWENRKARLIQLDASQFAWNARPICCGTIDEQLPASKGGHQWWSWVERLMCS